MNPKVLKNGQTSYELGAWDGLNGSGISPLCDKVVVLVDRALGTTPGGITLPDDVKDRATVASTTGVIVACGEQAFTWDSDRVHRWDGAKPEPGTRVCFEKYGGQEYPGLDGRLYRLMQDRTIGGTMGRAEMAEVAEPAGNAQEAA